MQIGQLDNTGIELFRDALRNAEEGADISDQSRRDLLQGGNAITLSQDIHLSDSVPLHTRYEVAEYLVQKLEPLDKKHLSSGLWSWLSLFFIRQICPGKVGETARYIPDSDNFRKYYRHLLYGPYSIYKQHEDDPQRANIVLYSPVHRPGDIVEALASRQELIASSKIIAAASKLYMSEGVAKIGAAGKDNNPGSARRFAAVMRQFMLTHDLQEISVDYLISILPPEFDKFKN